MTTAQLGANPSNCEDDHADRSSADLLTILLCATVHVARAQVVVPNSSFEDGTQSPTAWELTGGQGDLVSPGADGQHAISVTGDGKSSNLAISTARSGTECRVSLAVPGTSLQGTTGLPVSGPAFCNRDLASLGSEWTAIESFFLTPRQLTADLTPPAFRPVGSRRRRRVRQRACGTRGSRLSSERRACSWRKGNVLEGNRYTFEAPFQQVSANHARPLPGINARSIRIAGCWVIPLRSSTAIMSGEYKQCPRARHDRLVSPRRTRRVGQSRWRTLEDHWYAE